METEVTGRGTTARSPASALAGAALSGLALGSLFCLLEWAVLLSRLPVRWSPGIVGLVARNTVTYAVAGLASGAALGLVQVLLSAARRGAVRTGPLTRPGAAWAVLLSGWLAFYWVYAANVLNSGGARDARSLALDGLALLAGLAVAAALLVRVGAGARRREAAVWTALAVALLWLPFYWTAAGRTGERVDAGPDLSRVASDRAFSGDSARAPNLLLVVFDTTRTDCLGCYGASDAETPNIDRLAEDGLLFEQAVTPEPLTRPAVSTMLTGLYPRSHGVDTNTKSLSGEFLTLAEALRARGYVTGAFVSASVLSGYYGTDQGFDTYAEPTEARWELSGLMALKRLFVSVFAHSRWSVEIPAEEVTRRAVEWLGSNGDRPFFAFVHYFDPHYPYEPPPAHDLAAREGLAGLPRPYADPQERFRPGFDMPEDFLRMMWLRYRGEVEYADASFGKLMAALERMGLEDGTLVVVVSDHGESFEKGFYFAHGNRLYDPLVSVAMIFRCPGLVCPGRVETQVGLVDLYPTVLSLLNVPIETGVQGRVIAGASAAASGGARPVFMQTDFENPKPLSSRVSLGVRLPPWKYIESPELGLVELYDLAADPAEARNLASSRQDKADELASLLERWLDSTERREAVEEALSPERLEALRALGYVR